MAEKKENKKTHASQSKNEIEILEQRICSSMYTL